MKTNFFQRSFSNLIMLIMILAVSMPASVSASAMPDPGSGGIPLVDDEGEPALPAAEGILTDTIATLPVTATLEFTETLTPEVEIAATVAPTQTVGLPRKVFLPRVTKFINPPAAPERVRVCTNPNAAIPDGNALGVQTTINAQDQRVLLDMDVLLDIPHTWVGDLVVTLTHQQTGKNIRLIDRPGLPARDKGCRLDNIFTVLDDDSPLPVESACDYTGDYGDDLNPVDYSGRRIAPTISAVRAPEQPLKALRGETFAGAWTLTVVDQSPYDEGQVRNWCMDVTLGAPSQIPVDQPPPTLPRQAYVQNVRSLPQAMPLDCESRVAVDFAYFFGVSIGEANFFYNLPTSDNPELGFVGSVWGQWGQTPPNPYGVHAGPVANLLRRYGVPAQAHDPLSFSDLMAEIAAGRPVFVWIVDSVFPWTTPSVYWPSAGRPAMVANYQHVAMVVGYNEDTDKVTMRDNGKTYTASFGQFLRSWGSMGNQAITYVPAMASVMSLQAELAPSEKEAVVEFEAPPADVQLPVYGQGGYYYGPGQVVEELPEK